ncbi:MAG TPA: peptide chain release factor N(5)-glutamine methyltransferase [Candidatus Saccharimonadales bacterium]|nr:peptide chain release factor N(5)-glutamine methyltransferase [Candidatus Saccharimonadales bacterium]
MTTHRELLWAGIERLREAGAETPRLDAEVLLGFAAGVDRTVILAHPDALVGDGPAAAFRAAVERRVAGEPVAYIRGVKEFHGIALMVDPRVLIPRPETELLVDEALTETMGRLTAGAAAAVPGGAPTALRVVDVGTGSGAVAIALAVGLRARRVPAEEVAILAVDLSTDALDVARENAVGHAVGDRLSFAAADLLPPPGSEPWDLVLANLPYVRGDAMAGLPAPTHFEPALALDGGIDGLEVISRLLEQLPAALALGGVALLEIGADQGDAIGLLVGERLPGWRCRVVPDLSGLPRVAAIEREAAA